jgi:DNA-binding GntR family transcriptional regulator
MNRIKDDRSSGADTLATPMAAEVSLERAESIVRRIVAEQYDRPSLVPDIAVRIGAEIVEGLRAPGSDLNSVDLARRFQTSRTPIREALLLLEKQGLVSLPPRRRPTVFTFDLEQIREIYELRSRLLELVVTHIAARALPADIAAFKALVADMAQAQSDVRAFLWANVAFHDRMTAVGRNRLAKSVVDSLLLRTLPLRRLSLSQHGRVSKSLDDHQRLTRAFEERDEILAVALVRSNHMSALAMLEKTIRDLPAPKSD